MRIPVRGIDKTSGSSDKAVSSHVLRGCGSQTDKNSYMLERLVLVAPQSFGSGVFCFSSGRGGCIAGGAKKLSGIAGRPSKFI
jgi:hypothetical protein